MNDATPSHADPAGEPDPFALFLSEQGDEWPPARSLARPAANAPARERAAASKEDDSDLSFFASEAVLQSAPAIAPAIVPAIAGAIAPPPVSAIAPAVTPANTPVVTPAIAPVVAPAIAAAVAPAISQPFDEAESAFEPEPVARTGSQSVPAAVSESVPAAAAIHVTPPVPYARAVRRWLAAMLLVWLVRAASRRAAWRTRAHAAASWLRAGGTLAADRSRAGAMATRRQVALTAQRCRTAGSAVAARTRILAARVSERSRAAARYALAAGSQAASRSRVVAGRVCAQSLAAVRRSRATTLENARGAHARLRQANVTGWAAGWRDWTTVESARAVAAQSAPALRAVRDRSAVATGRVVQHGWRMARSLDAAARRGWAQIGASRAGDFRYPVAFLGGVVVGGLTVGLTLAPPAANVVRPSAPPAPAAAPVPAVPSAAAPALPQIALPVPTSGLAARDTAVPGGPAAAAASPVAPASAAVAPAATRPAGFRGSLSISSRPSGAGVFLNGKRIGTTPLVVQSLPIGSRAVRVTLPGHEPWAQAVQVVANRRTTVVATLRSAARTRN